MYENRTTKVQHDELDEQKHNIWDDHLSLSIFYLTLASLKSEFHVSRVSVKLENSFIAI